MLKKLKKTAAVLCAIFLISGNVSFAQEGPTAKVAKQKDIDAVLTSKKAKVVHAGIWNEKKGKETTIQPYGSANLSALPEINDENVTVIHNDGAPLETNIFENKEGNELFAIAIANEGGVEKSYYYISNTDVLMDNTLDEISSDISEIEKNADTNQNSLISPMALSTQNYYLKTYKWDFYRTLATGSTIQQGSLATNVEFTRGTTNGNINGTTGSVWDVETFSDLKARSTERINDAYTRLDVNYANQTLVRYGPYDSSGSTASISLSGLIDPRQWSFAIGGFTVDDLSSLSSKYGRWHYAARIGTQYQWVTAPGIRATNTSGNFALKLSQTVDYNYSSHGTGVITIAIPDR